ncbi:MAG: hypothetical protein WBV52_20335, partial [Pseudolabrys sp.]
EQVVGIVWLAQEGNRTGLHSACPHVFNRIGRDENNGDPKCYLASRQNRATEPASGHAPSQSLGSTCWTNFEPHGHFAVQFPAADHNFAGPPS